jgi:hypothetical protein
VGWLWLRTESIWIALAHGAMNNWGQSTFKYMKDFADTDPGLTARLAGAAGARQLLIAFGTPLFRAAGARPTGLTTACGTR